MGASTEAATQQLVLQHQISSYIHCSTFLDAPQISGGATNEKKYFGWHKQAIGPDDIQKNSTLVSKLLTLGVGQDTDERTNGQTDKRTISSS